MTVHRGVNLPATALRMLVPGSRHIENGFSSTSTDPKMAERFSHEDSFSMGNTVPVVFHHKLPAGARGLRVPGNNESEVLLPRGRHFKVVSVKKINGIHHVDVE